MLQARAQQIVVDGRTQTSVVTHGSVSDVSTKTINNGIGYNSFSRFDVNSGNTVNLYVPDQADHLLNIVHDKDTSINGILNTYKDGKIGGDVYFVNPNGIVVGKKGVINTGRMTLATPEKKFTDELIDNRGAINNARANAVIQGTAPLSSSGFVRIFGEVNATDELIIRSANQQITGTVREGAEASRVIFENVVNTKNAPKGATGVAVNSDGSISLFGAGHKPKTVTKTVKQMIVVDNRTETALQINEGHVDISTNTIRGDNAYNSFRIFDVFQGQAVNLVVPSQVSNLINVVSDKQSDISGQLTALRDGKVGGNVYFLNPFGVVVGASGIIRTGNLTLATPSVEQIGGILDKAKAPDQNDALALLNIGALQKNTKGIVNIKGLVEATNAINIGGKDVEISGKLIANGMSAAGILPKIVIHSVDNTVINGGQILAEGSDDRNGGTIEIRSENKIALKAGTLISASGKGENSNAGSVIVFAEDEAELGANATILARGGEVSGDGGFIELSGRKTVRLSGGNLDTGAYAGKAGHVLIDPEEIEISQNTCLGCSGAYSGAISAGSKFELSASKRISFASNVFLSTRQVGGNTDRNSHENGSSTGNSGSVILTAREIVMADGSAIFAQADNGYEAGDVTLHARPFDLSEILTQQVAADKASGKTSKFNADAFIELTNAKIKGRNVALTAQLESSDGASFVLQLAKLNASISLKNASAIKASGKIDIMAKAKAVVPDATLNSNRIYLLSSYNEANASVTIDGSSLVGGGAVNVEAKAETVSLASDLLTDTILPLPIPFDVAVGVAKSNATVRVLNNSSIESTTDKVSLISDSRAKVEAIGTARNMAFGLLNIPVVAAVSVGVITNKSNVEVSNSSIKAYKDVEAHSYALSENKTSFDVFGDGATKGAVGIGFNFADQVSHAIIRNSNVTSTTGGLTVQADSLQLAKQNGLVQIKDKAIDSVFKFIDIVINGVVAEFYTKEDGSADDTGKRIKDYWAKTKAAAKDVDKTASVFSKDWKDKSVISADKRSGTVVGAALGVLIALNDTQASVTADPSRSNVQISVAKPLMIKTRSNIHSQNAVGVDIGYESDSGSANAVSIAFSYEDAANIAQLCDDGCDSAISPLVVNANGIEISAKNFKVHKIDKDDTNPTILFRGDETLSAKKFENLRTTVANARAKASKATANAIALAGAFGTRGVLAKANKSIINLGPNSPVSILAENLVATSLVMAGDKSDVALLSMEAAEKRLLDQLGKVYEAKAKAKKEAQDAADKATNANDKRAAEKAVADADKDLKKTTTKQDEVKKSTGESKEKAKANIASVGFSLVAGFNYLNQNTEAVIGEHARISIGNGTTDRLGAIAVSAQSAIKKGGLSTAANLNGTNESKASSGAALNFGTNVLLGKTEARIEGYEPNTVSARSVANTLRSAGDVAVTATNETNFTIDNQTRTPEKVKKDATAATLVTVAAGVNLLATKAHLGRSVNAVGALSITGKSTNEVGTILIGSSAGGAVQAATNAATNTLDTLRSILTATGTDTGTKPGGTEKDSAEAGSTGIAAILDMAIIGTAIANSAKLAEQAKKAKDAEDKAKDVMKEQGKKDYVITVGAVFSSLDSYADTADSLLLQADKIDVLASNATKSDVLTESTSEFEEGAGANVMAVAVNLAGQDNKSSIGKDSTLVLGNGGLTVKANGDKGEFSAKSTGKSKLKGSQNILTLGVNIVKFENEAKIDENVSILSQAAYNAASQAAYNVLLTQQANRPNVTVSASAKLKFKAEGNATAGKNGLFFTDKDNVLTYNKKLRDETGAALGLGIAEMASPLITGYLDEKIRKRESELTKANGTGEGDAKGFGIGLNLGIVDVKANIANGHSISHVGDLTVASDAKIRTSAKGITGIGPSDEILSLSPKVSKSAATALSAAAGVNIVLGDIDASIGTAAQKTGVNAANLTLAAQINAKSLSIKAKTQALSQAFADGKAAGSNAADGVSGAVNWADFDTSAGLASSVWAFGDVAVNADANTVETVEATASARGTPIENYAAKLKTSINSVLLADGGVDSNSGLIGSAKQRFTAKQKEVQGKYDADAKKLTEKGDASRSFAAAMGFNFADHDTTATIGDNVIIDTLGAISIKANHAGMSRTEASGAAVLSDKATGAAISGNIILTNVKTKIGQSVVLGVEGRRASKVDVLAQSRLNTGVNVDDVLTYKKDKDGEYELDGNGDKIVDETFADFNYAAEAVAGAGGKSSSLAGALATTIYDGDTQVDIGNTVKTSATGKLNIGAYDQSRLANKVWGISVSTGTGTGPTRSARGGVVSVLVRSRGVNINIGNDFTARSGNTATIEARVLRPQDQWVESNQDGKYLKGPSGFFGIWATYVSPLLQGDVAAPLKAADPKVTQSLHNQAIAVAAAGSSNAPNFSGALAATVAVGKTKVSFGDRADIEASTLNIASKVDQDVLGIGGALTGSGSGSGAAFGAQGAAMIVLDDLETNLGKNGRFVATAGSASVKSHSDMDAVTINVVAALSGGSGATAAVNLAQNTFKGHAATLIGSGTSLTSSGDINVLSDNKVRGFAFAGTLAVSFGGANPVAATLVSNVQLSKAQVNLGAGARLTSQNGSITFKANTNEKLLTLPMAGGGIAGVIGVTVIKSETRASADATSSMSAANGNIKALSENTTDMLEVAGSLGLSRSGLALGLTGAGNGISKTVFTQIGNANAQNLEIAARSTNDIRQLAVAGGASTTNAGGVAIGVLVVKNEIQARIANNAQVIANGNIHLAAKDDSKILQFGGAVGFGLNNGVAADSGTLVVLGTTLAEVGDNAEVEAKANTSEVISYEVMDTIAKAKENTRSGIVNSFNGLKDTVSDLAHDVQGAFDALGNVGSSSAARDGLLASNTVTKTAKGLVVTADSMHSAVAIALGAGGGKTAGVGAGVAIGVLSQSATARVGSNVRINAAATPTGYGSTQDFILAAQNHSHVVGFSGMVGAGGKVGVGGGVTTNVFKGNTTAFVGAGTDARATRDIEIRADQRQKMGIVNFSVGAAGVGGVGAAINVGVVGGVTSARVDGHLRSGRNSAITASSAARQSQFVAAGGFGGKVGVGGAVNVLVTKGTTEAKLASTGTINALGATKVTARTADTIHNIVASGGGGGITGIAGSFNIMDSRRGTSAQMLGNINQLSGYNNSTASGQTLDVQADSSTDIYRLVGGIGGGGIAGFGVSFDYGSVLNQTDAVIGGNARVRAGGNVTVEALSAKNFAASALAGGGGGVTGIAGAISVNRTAYGSMNDYNNGKGQGVSTGDMNSQIGGLLASATSANAQTSEQSGLESLRAEARAAYQANFSLNEVNTQNMLETEGHDRAQAAILNGAIVNSGAAINVSGRDFTRIHQLAGSIGVGGTVGVGLTVSVNDLASSALATVGHNTRLSSVGRVDIGAHNKASLDAFNFAGAGGGYGVGAAGSINYNRLTNNASTTLGSSVQINASALSFKSENEQNIAASNIGIGAGLVGAGLSYTRAEVRGAARTTIGQGTQITANNGALDVLAEQKSRISVTGLAGAGGAFAGQAVVSEVIENANAVVDISQDVSLRALSGALSIAARNKAWAMSSTLGIALGAVAAGYSHAYSESYGDATVTIANNHLLEGTTVSIGAEIGELNDAGDIAGAPTIATIASGRGIAAEALRFIGVETHDFKRSEAFVLAGAGGGGAAQGSNLAAKTDNTAEVDLGTGSVLASSGDVKIESFNTAHLNAKVMAATFGTSFSVGVQIAKAESKNQSLVTLGSKISAGRNIKIAANSNVISKAESFSVAAGTGLSIDVSQARVKDHGKTIVTLSGRTAKATGNDIYTPGNVIIEANHQRNFDAKMNSFGLGLVGGGSGKLDYDIEATSNVDIGENRKILAQIAQNQKNGENVTIRAINSIDKDLFGDDNNINLNALGGIGVAIVNSNINVKTHTRTQIGRNNDIVSADKLTVKSITTVVGEETANALAGGLGAVATVNTHYTHSGIGSEKAVSQTKLLDGAHLTAGSVLEISALTDAQIQANSEGRAYGAGAALHVDAITKSSSHNDVAIADNVALNSYGEIFIGAGEERLDANYSTAFATKTGFNDPTEGDKKFGFRLNSSDVSSSVISFIGAAIGIPAGNKSRASSDQENTLSIGSNAKLRSAGNMRVAASDEKRGGAIAYIDVRNKSATSFLNAFMDIRGIGKTTKTGKLKIDGLLETGFDRKRAINISGTDANSVTGAGYNWQQAVSQKNGDWYVNYGALLGDVILRSGKEQGDLSGSGTIRTPVDAEIKVANTSSAKLVISGLDIPLMQGGRTYVNGTSIDAAHSGLLGGVTYNAPASDEQSFISILNSNVMGPDLLIAGAVNNLRGKVLVANIFGSVNLTAPVRAEELKILAGKDFSIDNDNADFNTGNDPIGEISHYWKAYLFYDTASSDSVSNTTPAPINVGNKRGEIQTLGAIYISARGVNINGLIRSGVSGRQTQINQTQVDAALTSAQAQRYKNSKSENDRYYHINDSLGFDPLTATKEQLASISINQLAEIPLFYDFETNRVVAKNLQAEGGTITIEGRIASTGRGKVEALDGYARFNIVNTSAAALELRDINTGDGVEGEIIFNDKNYASSTDGYAYVQTRWVRDGTTVKKYQNASNALTDGVAKTLLASGAAAQTYNPQAGQRYKWSTSADIYRNFTFRSHHEDKSDGENDINWIFREKDKAGSWQKMDYYWMLDRMIHGDWERYGNTAGNWSAPTNVTEPTGQLVQNSSDTSEFSYDRQVTLGKKEIQSFSSQTVCEASSPGVCWDYEVRPVMEWRQYYKNNQSFSVRADKEIAIAFFGETTGLIDVDNKGDIVIAGRVRNISGQTNLTSHNGRIYSEGTLENPSLLIANQLNLNAATGIGNSLANPLRLEQIGSNAIVNAKAPDIYLHSVSGSLRLGQLTTSGAPRIDHLGLIAEENIDLTASNMKSVVTATDISLTARDGAILTENGVNQLKVDTDAANGGRLEVKIGSGVATSIEEVSGDLLANTIDVAGDLKLKVSGDLKDGLVEGDKLAERDSRYASFLEKRDLDNGEIDQAMVDKAIAAGEQSKTDAYHEFWAMRRNGDGTYAAYNSDFKYAATTQERADLKSNGYTDGDIARLEESRTAFYHKYHDEQGPSVNETYIEDYAYHLSAKELAEYRQGTTFNKNEMLSAVNGELLGGDAAGSDKVSNIKAKSLEFSVGGSIGSAEAKYDVAAGVDGKLSVADMRRVRTAKVGELTFADDGKTAKVTKRNNVGIDAKEKVDIKAGTSAYLNSQGSLKVKRIEVGDTISLNANGDILNGNSDNSANVTGKTIVLSSSGENLGTAQNAFITETSDDGSLQIRTRGAAHISEKTGDLRLQDAAGPTLNLRAEDGRIIDAFGDKGKEIIGTNIKLYARDGIGEKGKSLDVETRQGGEINTQTPGDSYMYSPDEAVRIKDAVVGGISMVRSAKGIIVAKAQTFSAKQIDWYAPEDIVFERGSKVISRSGTAILNTDQKLIMHGGSSLDAQANQIRINAKGAVVLGNLKTSNAGTRAVTIISSGSINGNGDELMDIELSEANAGIALEAIGGIGGDAKIRTKSSQLALKNSGGGNVDIHNTGDVILEEVNAGEGSSVDIDVLGDVLAKNLKTVDGLLKVTTSGTMTQEAGSQIDGGIGSVQLIAAHDALLKRIMTKDAGNITITAQSGKVTLEDAVTNMDGAVSVTAATDLTLGEKGSVQTKGLGDVMLVAKAGNINQDKQAQIDGGTGSVQLTAGKGASVHRITTKDAGNIAITAQDGDLLLNDLIQTADGSIRAIAKQDMKMASNVLLNAQGSGSIELSTTVGSFIQQDGSLIDGGQGLVRVQSGYNVVLRDVLSTHPSRFRITAIAGNYLEDSGNEHRGFLEKEINDAELDNRGSQPTSIISNVIMYLQSIYDLVKPGAQGVVSRPTSNQSAANQIQVNADGALILVQE